MLFGCVAKKFLIVSSLSLPLVFHLGFRLRKLKSSKLGGKFYDVRVLNWLRNFMTFECRNGRVFCTIEADGHSQRNFLNAILNLRVAIFFGTYE